jgi:membrane protein implicated in regulation of membrane protease activity
MAKLLLLIAIVVVVVVIARVLRSRSHREDDPAAHRRTHSGQHAAVQAEAAHHGRVSGGFGP